VNTKVGLLLVSALIVLLPWLAWRVQAVRRVAPLAVVQILAGVLLGPSLLGRVAPGLHAALFTPPVLSALDGVAALGVLLYVFATGLHLDTTALRVDARRLGLVALGSVAVPFALGLAAAGWILARMPDALGPAGSTAGFMVAVALCIAVTALPVLAAVLQEMGLLGTRLGQVALAVAALNDAALWLMLAVLLAVAGAGGSLLGLALAVLWVAVLLCAIRPLLRRLERCGEQAMLVAGVSLAIVSAGVSEALGTGYLIGAFLAGAIMPPACRAPVLARLELLTATVLLPFFFMSTGLKALIDPFSAGFLFLLLVATGTTMLGKLAGTAPAARAAGFSFADSLALGAMMQTKGLMEVVVLAVLHEAGLIGSQIFSAMVAMAMVCTVATAPLVRLCRRTPQAARALNG
jgi:Kef-type K+ transport system membrane component KefB